MATLEKIRSKAGCLVIAIGFALLAFLAGDFFRGGSTLSRAKENNAFYVNGKEIPIQEYNARVVRAEEQYRGQNGSLTQAQNVMLRNQIYSSMVAENVLREEAEKIGLKVTPEEIFQLIQGDNISPVILQNPMFLTPQGVFDKAGLLNFLKVINSDEKSFAPQEQGQLQKLKSIWLDVENQVENYRLNEKYADLVASAIVTNKLEAEFASKYASTISNLTYVAFKAVDASDSLVTITDKDVQAYYDIHSDMMRTEGGSVLDIIYANISPSEADFQTAQKDTESARQELLEGKDPTLTLQEYSDIPYANTYLTFEALKSSGLSQRVLEFISTATVGEVSPLITEGNVFAVAQLVNKKSSPESLKVSHILLASNSGTKVDSLLAIVSKSPSEFANQAQVNSLDSNSAVKGGEMGWMDENIAKQYLGSEFAEALYSAKVGVPFKCTSKFGTHLVLVNEAKPNVLKYNVALSAREVTASTETHTKVYNELSHFLATNKDKGGIDSIAINAGFQVLSNINVQSAQPAVSKFIPESREVIRWAMQNKKGETSTIMECGDKYVVARIKDKYDAGILPYQLVAEQLRPVVVMEKKVEALYDQLKKSSYTSLEECVAKTGNNIDTLNFVKFGTPRLESIGYQPALNAVATLAPLNKLVPVKGNGSAFLVTVNSREEDKNATTQEALVAEITNGRRGTVRMGIIPEIMKHAQLEDYRWKFF